MTIETLLVQFLVLAFTAALWWIARRDLAGRASSPPAETREAAMQELEQLCATLEALVTDLTRRLERVEGQSERVEGQSAQFPTHLPAAALPAAALPAAEMREQAAPDDPPDTARYAPVYALLDEGVTDPLEIVQRTGLSRGEIDLILSLRARRAL